MVPNKRASVLEGFRLAENQVSEKMLVLLSFFHIVDQPGQDTLGIPFTSEEWKDFASLLSSCFAGQSIEVLAVWSLISLSNPSGERSGLC